MNHHRILQILISLALIIAFLARCGTPSVTSRPTPDPTSTPVPIALPSPTPVILTFMNGIMVLEPETPNHYTVRINIEKAISIALLGSGREAYFKDATTDQVTLIIKKEGKEIAKAQGQREGNSAIFNNVAINQITRDSKLAFDIEAADWSVGIGGGSNSATVGKGNLILK